MHMDAKNLAELYGLPLVDWQRVEARLAGPEQLAGTGGADNRSWLATLLPVPGGVLAGARLRGRACFNCDQRRSAASRPVSDSATTTSGLVEIQNVQLPC